MKRNEKIIAVGIFILLFLLLSWILYLYNIQSQYGDSTFAAQVLNNFKHGNLSLSASFTDSIGQSMKSIWYRSADYVCKQPLISKPYSGPWGHYYLIMFTLIPLTWIFDIYVLMAILQSFFYTSVLAFAYFFSRDRKINLLNSILLTVIVSQHPLWRFGLFGQFYFNRFFLPLSAIVIWLLTRKKINYMWLSIATLLALSTNEVYGIVLLTIFFSYGLFFNKRERKKLFLMGILSGLYSFITLSLILSTIGSYATQVGFIKTTFSPNILATAVNLFHNAWTYKTLIFLLVNIGFLGILTFARFETSLLMFFFLLPNLLINIGGAEKTGWSTHYHINYFIPLIWLSIFAFSNLKFKKKYILTLILLIVLFISMIINPDKLIFLNKPYIEIKNLINNFFYYTNKREILFEYKRKLRDAVGKNNTVSIPEAIAYDFIDYKTYYYPLNIDIVDKVIFKYYPENKGENKFGSINYGQQDDKLDECIKERMKLNGFDFNNAKVVDGWAVIGKRQQ